MIPRTVEIVIDSRIYRISIGIRSSSIRVDVEHCVILAGQDPLLNG